METMRISQVAARSGVPPTTLRYYEDLGLLRPQRAPNGYRLFDDETLERLRFIDAAKQLNLPLEQIASLLSVWESDPCASVKARLRPLLGDQLEQIDAGIGELSEARHALAAAIEHLDELPDRTERCSPDCAFLATAPAPPSPPPVACSLGAGQQDRIAQWHEALADAPLHPVAGGVRIDLPIAALGDVSSLAVAEQECCPFFSFDIALRGLRFTLTITAPPEGMPMLEELIPGHTEHASPAKSKPH